MNILEKIIAHKQQELAKRLQTPHQAGGLQNILEKNTKIPDPVRDDGFVFGQAIKKKEGQIAPNIIAEIKQASPSKGHLLADGDILALAQAYETHGASAVSILTDEKFFGGSIDDLRQIQPHLSIPVLRKDFIFTREQIAEAAEAGASAVLLMVSVVNSVGAQYLRPMSGGCNPPLPQLINYTHSLGLDALVETHSAAEIEIAVAAGAKIIGVNSRDFDDLSLDLSIFPGLLPLIPDHIIKVAESGIYSRADIEPFSHLCDAILVGSSLMEAGISDIPGKIKEFKSH